MPAALTHESTERSWKKKKKEMITYSKILQIATAADQLASKKILETPQLVFTSKSIDVANKLYRHTNKNHLIVILLF